MDADDFEADCYQLKYRFIVYFAEQEENRIKYLKDLLEAVDQDDWKYEPIDSLIGLQHQ